MNTLKHKRLIGLREKYTQLLENYQPTVMGNGNPDAEIVLVGEAPGRHEVEQCQPFVGQAGKNLDEFLDVLELKRDDLYITNAVKFRPVRRNNLTGSISNRAPARKEIEEFRSLLMEEIDIINPSVVVTLGNTPLFAITNMKIKIGDVHGSPMEAGSRRLFPLYHPASIIYRKELKPVYYEDLKKLKSFIKDVNVII